MSRPRLYPTRAPTAAPANALRMWTDGRTLYVELAAKPGVDRPIVSYALDASGLSKALALLVQTRYDFGGSPAYTTPQTLQEAMAESLLRQRGLIR